MGRSWTNQEANAAKRTTLNRFKRELEAAGVPAHKVKSSLISNSADVYDKWGTDAASSIKFEINVKDTMVASNGECCFNTHIMVCTPIEAGGKIENYGFVDLERGLARIKSIFGDEANRKNLPQTNLAALVQLVEDAVMHKCKTLPGNRTINDSVILFDEKGERLGEVYAYNDMKLGVPMLRISPLNDGRAFYTEFRPGYVVRLGNGTIVAERKG